MRGQNYQAMYAAHDLDSLELQNQIYGQIRDTTVYFLLIWWFSDTLKKGPMISSSVVFKFEGVKVESDPAMHLSINYESGVRSLN